MSVHKSIRGLLKRLVRNVLGFALIVVGVVLWLTPLVPGGALALLGLLLVDFPGKRRLIRRLRSTELFTKLLRGNPRLSRIWKRLTAQIDP